MSEHRQHGGRLSLTAFEAQWLWLILDTCREIAADTFPHVPNPPRPTAADPLQAFDRILDKLGNVTPQFGTDA